jgi:hypothetical protein
MLDNVDKIGNMVALGATVVLAAALLPQGRRRSG